MHRLVILLALLCMSGIAYAGEKKDDCHHKADCNRAAPSVVFKGTIVPKKQIEVVVCYPDWDRLSVGSVGGKKTKWWRGRLRYPKGGSADLPIVTERCKRYFRVPGEEIEGYDCEGRLLSTGPMQTPGEYPLKPKEVS